MRGILSKLIRVGLDLAFGKAERFEYTHATTRCPNCQRPL